MAFFAEIILSNACHISCPADLNEQAQERFELIEAQMRSAEGITEELKRQNPMEWVHHCNNIRNRASEIIKQELIYV